MFLSHGPISETALVCTCGRSIIVLFLFMCGMIPFSRTPCIKHKLSGSVSAEWLLGVWDRTSFPLAVAL